MPEIDALCDSPHAKTRSQEAQSQTRTSLSVSTATSSTWSLTRPLGFTRGLLILGCWGTSSTRNPKPPGVFRVNDERKARRHSTLNMVCIPKLKAQFKSQTSTSPHNHVSIVLLKNAGDSQKVRARMPSAFHESSEFRKPCLNSSIGLPGCLPPP